MKIVKTEGCVVSGINIDGQDITYLEDSEKEEYYKNILSWFRNNYSEDKLKMLIELLTDYFGEYKYLYTCEQCGDSVGEYTVEI